MKQRMKDHKSKLTTNSTHVVVAPSAKPPKTGESMRHILSIHVIGATLTSPNSVG